MRGLLALVLLLCLPTVSAQDAVQARILVQSSPLAGFQFHEGKRLWAQLNIGDTLEMVREPDNPHDPRAVRIDWRGYKLGYLPRRENQAVARQLDFGNRLQARITRLTRHRDPWKRIEFEIFLPL
ncbi:MAG TPA: HIRAN domain-containing protein [Burkholderiales bacterium]|nr:HIRAN domain-containing protein [Burkholderiales bacterium]